MASPIKYGCFVLGCSERGFVGSRHKSFGLVVACQSHDLVRHGYAIDLGAGPVIIGKPMSDEPTVTPGGAKVLARTSPKLPPSNPGVANVLAALRKGGG